MMTGVSVGERKKGKASREGGEMVVETVAGEGKRKHISQEGWEKWRWWLVYVWKVERVMQALVGEGKRRKSKGEEGREK